MITFLLPQEIVEVKNAEISISSFNEKQGSFGEVGVFSFNGNKIMTSGGGGAIVTNNIRILKMKLSHNI